MNEVTERILVRELANLREDIEGQEEFLQQARDLVQGRWTVLCGMYDESRAIKATLRAAGVEFNDV